MLIILRPKSWERIYVWGTDFGRIVMGGKICVTLLYFAIQHPALLIASIVDASPNKLP